MVEEKLQKTVVVDVQEIKGDYIENILGKFDFFANKHLVTQFQGRNENGIPIFLCYEVSMYDLTVVDSDGNKFKFNNLYGKKPKIADIIYV